MGKMVVTEFMSLDGVMERPAARTSSIRAGASRSTAAKTGIGLEARRDAGDGGAADSGA